MHVSPYSKGASPQGQRRVHGPGLSSPPSRTPSLRRRGVMVGRDRLPISIALSLWRRSGAGQRRVSQSTVAGHVEATNAQTSLSDLRLSAAEVGRVKLRTRHLCNEARFPMVGPRRSRPSAHLRRFVLLKGRLPCRQVRELQDPRPARSRSRHHQRSRRTPVADRRDGPGGVAGVSQFL